VLGTGAVLSCLLPVTLCLYNYINWGADQVVTGLIGEPSEFYGIMLQWAAAISFHILTLVSG
jgi:hypothetical protein